MFFIKEGIISVLFIGSILFSTKSFGQKIVTMQPDLDLLRIQNDTKKPPQIIYRHQSGFQFSYNPITFILRSGLYIYQHQITHQITSNCMYSPSCSEFSRQSLAQYGFLKGVSLTLDRLTRCTKLQAYYNIKHMKINTELKFVDDCHLYHWHE